MSEVKAGLRGVAVGSTALSDVDGIAGRLIYRGIDIHELAMQSSFEETAWLLWYGALPTATELAGFSAQLAREAAVAPGVLEVLRGLPKGTAPMDALRTGVSLLHHYDPDRDDNSIEASKRKAVRLTAQTATIVAAIARFRRGLDAVAPDPSLPFAANLVWMLNGEKPNATAVRSLDLALILHADHGFNASTFTARVITSTLSDLHSAITGAIGALKGPLHGGANEAVMKTLLKIEGEIAAGRVRSVEEWTKNALANKERLMGFGHAVYKTEDPRATHLRRMSRELCEQAGQPRWYEWSAKMEELVKAEKGLNPNVDFYSASVYYVLGFEPEMYTCLFAVSRMTGWTAHAIEQLENNRLIRPEAEWTGPTNARYVPIGERR
ncbi:MAG: citrate/2-methylcitrate synthase [Candidatus Eiseniibacteriota bacterium]